MSAVASSIGTGTISVLRTAVMTLVRPSEAMSAAATPSAVDVMPSMPDAPRLPTIEIAGPPTPT